MQRQLERHPSPHPAGPLHRERGRVIDGAPAQPAPVLAIPLRRVERRVGQHLAAARRRRRVVGAPTAPPVAPILIEVHARAGVQVRPDVAQPVVLPVNAVRRSVDVARDDELVRLLYQLQLALDNHSQAKQVMSQYSQLLERENFSASEIESILAEFPQKLPEGGWLTA